MNDMDALDQQGRTARKAFDGSGPLGPWIETDVDPTSLDISTTVGGEQRQDANTKLMLFGPHEIVSYLSKRFTFEPGDCIAFGSPANPGLVEPANASKSPTRASERCRTRSSRESNRERFLKHVRWRAPANARRA